MPDNPEARARKNIDRLLTAAGWVVQSRDEVNLTAGRGVAVREFPMKTGFGEADYLLYVDGQALGVVEAKKEGSTLTGFEGQTAKYSEGLPDTLPAPKRPLPFGYQSTGIETRFTNPLEPDAASRNVFSFHRPETLAQWLRDELAEPNSTVEGRVRQVPALAEEGLRPAQIKAIKNLELSLGQGKPRALIQMASGGGKTFTACNFIYRLIKYAGARRVLFLVDRSNLGRQTLKEFQNFRTPVEQRLFTELYNVQHLQSNKLDSVIIGFVGADPEQRQARNNNGSKFTVLSVATQRSWKNTDDEWASKTEWHRVCVFRPRLAEYVATTIKKGAHVLVEGSLVSTTYERGNGKGKKAKTNKQTFWCIRADVVRKLDRGEPEPETVASGSAASSEALDATDPAPF